MGAVHSDQMVKQYKTNREIEKQLQESKTIDDRTIKTLLLGSYNTTDRRMVNFCKFRNRGMWKKHAYETNEVCDKSSKTQYKI